MKETTVGQIADYIERNLEGDLTLDRIAGELHYSKFYMERIFSEKAGCTISQYIRGRRLTAAARKLAETKKPIVEIACEANYGSQQAFTLAFGRLYHCTPQTYRKNGVFYPAQPRVRAGVGAPVIFRGGLGRGGVLAA